MHSHHCTQPWSTIKRQTDTHTCTQNTKRSHMQESMGCITQNQRASTLKGWMVNTFGFVGHRVSVATT